jgi:nucleoside 2-deoxyribosyltransferase
MKVVYLAGPILGHNKSEANDWRTFVNDAFSSSGLYSLTGISPLRCEPLVGEVYAANYPDPKFGTARAIASKNMFDVRSCDMVLAYMPKPTNGRPHSVGTILEIGWASILCKPVVLVTDDPFLVEHPVMNASVGWVLPTLEDGIDVCTGLLGGYVGGKNV